MEKIKVLSLFSGYGGAEFALKKANIPHEVVGFSDIDKYAQQIWKANHGENVPLYEDVTKIDEKELPDFDLLTGGFPCQAFSMAGKRKGFEDLRGTLIYDILRIAKHKKPKYMLLENVKGLLSHDNGNTWRTIQWAIKLIGYDICTQVMNSKDYGIPQNRERIWIVCKLGKWNFMEFSFPKKEELKLLLKDILEDNVDEKYYLSETHMENLRKNDNMNCNPSGNGMNGNVYSGDIAPTLTTNKGEGIKVVTCNSKGQAIANTPEIGQANRIYHSDGLAPALNVGWTPLTLKANTSKGYVEANVGDGICLEHMTSTTRRGRVQKQISPTLSCDDLKGVVVADFRNDEGLRIRENGLSPCLTASKNSETELSRMPPLVIYNSEKKVIPSKYYLTNDQKDKLLNKIKVDISSVKEPTALDVYNKKLKSDGICPTLTEPHHNSLRLVEPTLRIRKLTPRECFRLMGFLDDEINYGGLSNSQLYKRAGNGWCISVVSKILTNLFK